MSSYTPNLRRVMWVMVSLIVVMVMLVTYIWLSGAGYYLPGRKYSQFNDLKQIESELKTAKEIIDSLTDIQEAIPPYEVRVKQPDSVICDGCPFVEKINGGYYELFGSFHHPDDARFLVSQLLRNKIHNIFIFKRQGLQAIEIPLNDSIPN